MTINRYKLKIEYNGSNFCGWQKQSIQKGKNLEEHLPSIERAIQLAIFNLCQESPKIFCAGRTDAGVHALEQVIHFDLQKFFTPYRLMHGINFYLPEGAVAVKEVEPVDNNFHARFSATKRYYRYIIINRPARLTIDKNLAWHIPVALDIQKMHKSAQFLLGTHDFSSFRDGQCQAKSPIKTIDTLSVTKEGEKIIIDISAKSFLHHMVRNIVGTLVKMGSDHLPVEAMPEILSAKNRSASGPNAPACGLYFFKVEY